MSKRETAAKIAAFVLKFTQLEDDGESIILDGHTKSQAIAAAEHLKIISEARSKGGKSGGGGRKPLPESKLKPNSLKQRERRAKKENT